MSLFRAKTVQQRPLLPLTNSINKRVLMATISGWHTFTENRFNIFSQVLAKLVSGRKPFLSARTVIAAGRMIFLTSNQPSGIYPDPPRGLQPPGFYVTAPNMYTARGYKPGGGINQGHTIKLIKDNRLQ